MAFKFGLNCVFIKDFEISEFKTVCLAPNTSGLDSAASAIAIKLPLAKDIGGAAAGKKWLQR